ncbi:hypothetical protein ACFY8C_38490 [Streptomyces flavochromogenes]|uniref:Conjugal transfer protein n=1 Tax=Streptomyces flavochromogenes TaxID=68199 RepID=A0ABW6Y332_9ACTN
MSKDKDEEQRTAAQFRELLKSGYDYPEGVEEQRGRRRRRARRAFRKGERDRTTQWIDQERRREPISSRAALLVVVALLAIGVLGRYGPAWITGQDAAADKVTATASATPSGHANDKPAPSSPAAPSPSPDAVVDLSVPDRVAEEFVRNYLTRNPPVDEDHTAAVRRAAPWATAALVDNLSGHDDPAFARLVSRGGVATVATVTVKPADTRLPGDTPLRVWRTVTAKVDVVGYTTYSETTTLQTELIHDGAGWRVDRILGV